MKLKIIHIKRNISSAKNLIFLFMFCLVFLYSNQVDAAASDSLHISRQNWKKTIGNKDYTETYETPKSNPRFNFNPSLSWIKSDSSRIIFTIVVIGVLVLLLYLLLRNKVFNFNKKINNKAIYQEFSEDADINELDLESIFDKLMKEMKYRFAIRIRFLMALKMLVNQELLIWEKDKTNGDYIRELAKTDIVHDFRQLVIIYERIWFSEIEITASDFRILDTAFTKFNTKLKKDE